MTDQTAPIAERSSQARPEKARTRAKVSNGAAILPDVDGRSAIARRFRDICQALVIDQGGSGRLSEARGQLIRRFAAAAVLSEQLEAKLANGEEIDLQSHALLCSSLVRLAQRIGLGRHARNITPSLTEYLDVSTDDGPALEDDEPASEDDAA